jgi:ribonuclease P protein component
MEPPMEPPSLVPGKPRLLFTPAQRLVAGKQFEAAYKGGRRKGDSLFGVIALPNGLPQARLGMAVSIKSCGNAVRRNLVRRVIRNTFRECQYPLAGLDIVVNSRPGAREAANADIVSSLERLFRQLATISRRPPDSPTTLGSPGPTSQRP